MLTVYFDAYFAQIIWYNCSLSTRELLGVCYERSVMRHADDIFSFVVV